MSGRLVDAKRCQILQQIGNVGVRIAIADLGQQVGSVQIAWRTPGQCGPADQGKD